MAVSNPTKPTLVPPNPHSASGQSTNAQQHLLELASNPSIVKTPDFDFGVTEEDSEYDEDGYSRQVLGSCKSWMTSMIIHLVVILSLALLTMRSSVNQIVRLEMGTDEYSVLTDLQELEFDAAEFQSFDEADTTPETVTDKLMEFEPELEMDQFEQAPVDFDNPLDSDANQLQRLAREMSSHELLAGDAASSFFGIEASGQSIVYIVDRSGSMQGARWADATRELLKSVNSLKPDQKFLVFLFSVKCHPMPQMEGRNSMVTATDNNKQRFRKWLARQHPDDTTKPLSSVRRALNLKPDTIFLLTDGQFYDNTGDYLIRRSALQKKRTDGDSQVINTIAFYCDFELELMLQEIAAVHNGTFRSIQ